MKIVINIYPNWMYFTKVPFMICSPKKFRENIIKRTTNNVISDFGILTQSGKIEFDLLRIMTI
jgi:hypothetical protein